MLATLSAVLLLSSCSEPATIDPSLAGSLPEVAGTPSPVNAEEAQHVLVVINKSCAESTEIGSYYRSKRSIPKENVILISVSLTEDVSEAEYQKGILEPIKQAIKYSKHRIDYIVMTGRIPIRLSGSGYSVDAFLATMDMSLQPITELKEENIRRCISPYYGSTEPFDSSKFKMYLVTRLIGYTVDEAKRLVDNSLAAKNVQGPFFIDKAGNRTDGGYGQMEQKMEKAFEVMSKKGFDVQIDREPAYVLPPKPMMGYCSWGSNDGMFSGETYYKLRFLPGAVCETFVSTSGRTFRPTSGGQSLIVDLVRQGVTGVKGYVHEPYTFALADPAILFDRYTGGMNLAESFYAASPILKWKDVVVGDPLCRPYAR